MAISILHINKSPTSDLSLNDILKYIDLKRYYLSGKFEGIYLTKREVECIICLARGYSVKQIGKILNLSDRTIECYVHSLKQKLISNDKAKLIETAIECGLLESIKPTILNGG